MLLKKPGTRNAPGAGSEPGQGWGPGSTVSPPRCPGPAPPQAPARYSSLVEHASADGRPTRGTRGLLYCGLVAGPVFVTTFLAEGATRDGYRPSRHPVSSLALGPRGRVQVANFAVAGTLVLAGAVGLGRAANPGLSSRAEQALIGAAGPASSAQPSSPPTR